MHLQYNNEANRLLSIHPGLGHALTTTSSQRLLLNRGITLYHLGQV
jgi:hypothetical protein